MIEKKKKIWQIVTTIVAFLLIGLVLCVLSWSNKTKTNVIKNYNKDIEQLQQKSNTLNNTLNITLDELEQKKMEIKILSEENESLTKEIEELREENARLTLAADTLQEEMEDIVVVENNYSIISMTDDERDLLAKILALEAGDQSDVGQRAVVEVVFNRIMTGWADTVEKVIYQKGQFSTVAYLKKPYAVPDEKEYANIDYVLEHGSTILPSDYVYFATYKANGKDFITIEDHYFAR